MIAIALILLAAYVTLAAWMGLRADRRFSRHARLPMQWWLDGRPTWYAPRRLALILIPVVSGAGFLLMIVAAIAPAMMAPERMSSHPGLPILLILATLGIGLFALYLRMVALWDRATV